MARLAYNHCYTFLDGALDAVDTTSIAITDALKEGGLGGTAIATIAAPDILVMSVDDEIIHITAYTSGSLVLTTILRGQDGTTAAAHANGARVYNTASKEDIGRCVLSGWFQDNVPGSQTDIALVIANARTEIPMPVAGSIVGITIFSNEARTAGTATVEPTINGTGIGLTAVLDGTNTTTHTAAQAEGLDKFTAGQRIGVKITSASWTPTTADISVAVLVTLT